MTQALTSTHQIYFKGFESLAEKVLTGQRLSFEEGVRLFRDVSLPVAGYLANIRRESVSNHKAYYIRNQVINYSNICVNHCAFCAFHRKRNTTGAYTLSLADIEKKFGTISANRLVRFMWWVDCILICPLIITWK